MKRFFSMFLVVCILLSIIPCRSFATASNDYTQWRQGDSEWNQAQAWPASQYPDATMRYMSQAGCLVCSVAMLLRHYNVVTESDVNKFNPWICNEKLKSVGAFDSAADMYWSGPQKAYPGFVYIGVASYSQSKLVDLYSQGYACIVKVSGSGGYYHYVAVRNAGSSGVTIMDPGWGYTSLSSFASKYEIYYYRATPSSCNITFDANGGSCSTTQKTISPGSAIGTLPTPTRSGYDFAGWHYDKAASYDDPVSSSTTFSSATTLYAHWASQLYKGNKIIFNTQGGQLSGASTSRTIDGYNVGRGGNELIVYNCAGNTVNTNSYGVEVAVNSEGKVTSKRAYGSTSILTVPSGGFVLSGHVDASNSGGNFVAAIEVGNYVAYNKSANKAYVYTSKNAYLANQKYVSSGSTYGELPTPTNGSKAFQGWYTATTGGTKITSSSTYSTSTLYARWDCDHSYGAEYIPGNCVQYASVKYTCTKCGHSYTEYSSGEYSDWSTTYPTGIDSSLVQSKTQYRYSDYETKTSYETSLSGWTQLSSEWVKSGSGNIKYVSSWPSGFNKSHSLYSTYNKSPKSNSETSTTKTTVSTSTCGYIYYHWCRGTYTGGPINRKTSPTSSGEFNTFHAFYSTTTPSSLGSAASDGSYVYANGSCCKDSHWYYPIAVSSQDYTTYNKLFTYYRWTSWSSWSDSAYYASSTRKVETRTLYRYAVAPIGEHTWNGGSVTKQPTCTAEGVRTYTCTVCGETKTETIAKIDHKYDSGSVTRQPTCTAEGVRTYTCTGCGQTKTESIAKVAHQYDGGTVTKEPTCTDNGVKTFTCTGCGTAKTESVSKLGHNFVNGYCTRCGTLDPSYTFTTSVVKVGTASVSAGETVTIPVSLTSNTGIAGFTFLVRCQDGVELTEIKAGEILNTGVFESNVATGKVTWFNAKNITGNGTLLYLTVRAGSKGGRFAVSIGLEGNVATNFVDEHGTAKPVTFSDGSLVVEAHTHSYTTTTVLPTCTDKGYTLHTCSCGNTYRDEEVAALGHDWTAWRVIVAATVLQDGTEERNCTRCEKTETRTIPKTQNPFVDVKEGDYFYTPVLWAVQNGITNGTSATTFSPNNPCTRAQIVTFLWRANGSPEPKLSVNPFKDVNESAYYYKAVLWAVEKGITTGTSATAFSPEATCTRGQVATFLWRSQGKLAPTSTSNPFSDVNDHSYYYDAVLWAVENSITNGTGKGKFSPDDSCTRGQIVTFLYRALI